MLHSSNVSDPIKALSLSHGRSMQPFMAPTRNPRTLCSANNTRWLIMTATCHMTTPTAILYSLFILAEI